VSRRPRILVADDDPQVLAAYRHILAQPPIDLALDVPRAALFDEPPAPGDGMPHVEVTLVDQGEAAIEAVALATAQGGYAMAFIDMRMPPGIDGFATIERLWTLDADLQIVVASAYSDVPWAELVARFGHTDRLLFLKKPFAAVEARQMAAALCRKRELLRESRQRERELEQNIVARTRELAQALREAEEAARARMQFLANMSHEIRTPLTAILGFAEMLRDPACTEHDRNDHVGIIDRNSQHLLQLVNDVLDLSKLEANQLLLDLVPANIADLVAEVRGMMRPLATQKGLWFETSLTGACPTALVTDGMRVRQILLNLIGNAIKFTAQGGVHLAVGRLTAGSPMLALTVTDTGIGIAGDRLPTLFAPFVQADASTSRQFGGTGLGLSISRRLANLLGGSVTVASTPGRGSTFTLALPAGERAIGPELTSLTPGADAATSGRGEPQPRLAGRILLAEDGLDNQRLLSTILTKAGAEVHVAADGSRAVELALASQAAGVPFALILMDMQMPVMDGYTAVRMLRQRGWHGPIVALTAHAMEGDRDRCLAEGCDGYETKPVRASRLITTCARFLRPSLLRRHAPATRS
jgi:two-component system, sensor histidine kinase and response regulator